MNSDEEVLKRLPFWIRELLRLVDEVQKEKRAEPQMKARRSLRS